MAPSRRRFEQPSAVVGDSILAALGAMEDEEEPHRSMTQTVKKRQSGFRNTSTITETVVSVRSSSSSSSSFSSGVSEETAGGDGVTESDVGSKDSLEESEEERVSDADSSVASFRGDPRTAEGFDGDDNASNSDEGEEYGLDGDESDFDPEEVSEDEEDDDESVLEEVEDADEIYAARLQKNNGSGTTGANNSSVMGTNKDDANLIFSDDDEETFSPYSSNGSSHDSPDGDSHEIESLDANNWIGKAPQEGSTIAVDKTDESFGGGGDNFSCDSVNRSVDPQVLETLSYSEEENEQKDGGPIGARVALSPMSSHLYPPIVQITTVAGRADTDFVSPLGTSLQRASRLSRKHSVVDEDVVVAVIVDDSDDESSEIEAVVAEILGSDDEDDETVLQSPNLSPRSASTSPSADFVSDGKESKNSSKQNDMADAAHGTSSQIAVRASPAKRNNVTCTSIAQDNKSNGKSPKQSPTNRNLSSSFSKQLMAGEDGIFRDNGAFVSSPSEKTLLSEKANFSSGGQDLLSSSMAAEMASKSLLQTIASPFHCPDERELPELFDSKDSRLATFHESNFLSAETDSAVTSGPTSDVEYATPISEADASLKHDDKEAHRSADETPLLPREQPSLACTVGRLSDAESGSEAALVQTASCSVSESVDVVDSFASNDIKALGQVCGIRYDLHHCSECDSGSIHLPRDPSPGADIICAATGSVELSEVILKADYLCSGSVGTNCPTSAGDFQDVLPPQLRSLADIKGRKRKEVKFLFPDATTGENLASLESGKENSRIFATTVLPDAKIVAQQRRENQRAGGVRREGSIKRGQWKLGSKIGSGAFGVVHIGMNTETGKLMAVKSLRMEAAVMNDAKREVQLLKSLEHINIVRYYGAEMDSKYLHIFQEWIPGGSVASLLAKFGPFPIYVLRSYLGQTITGLEYLHNNNILHRDIKGSNILVNDEGIVKLADFGAGKHLGEWQTDMMLSMTMRGSKFIGNFSLVSSSRRVANPL